MKIWNGEHTADIPVGATAAQALSALGLLGADTLAAMSGGLSVDLSAPLPCGGKIAPVTLADEEGRRVYERSLRFVLLLALRRRMPGQRVRIEHSVHGGVLIRLPGRTVTGEDLDGLREEMRGITAARLPFTQEVWPRERAIDYFAADGQEDKAALLRTRPYDWFRVYRCGEMVEYFYGVMAPDTGSVAVFDLAAVDSDGFALLLPTKGAADTPQTYLSRPKHMAVFAQSSRWCGILGVTNVADLTALQRRGGLREFIRVNEVLHDLAMGEIAERIVEENRRVVLVAGPSSSGKTTFAGRMAVQLRVKGCRGWRLSLDDYYLDRDAIPREPDGTLDLEHLRTLDLDRFQADVNRLLRGEEAEIPRFSFVTGKREPEGHPLRLGEGEVLIVEGIHALNPELSAAIPPDAVHRIFVSDLTCLNLDDHNRIRTTDVRLLRRIVRDHRCRGTTPEETLAMWPSVRQGEERWIFPFQERADSVFNTALHYELPVLRHFAYDLLEAVPPEAEGYLAARRLMKLLHYIPDIDERILDEIPPLSLLREFIGGCTIDEV